MRNPSLASALPKTRAVAVWKLPMRNPSTFSARKTLGRTTCLEATYEESKQGVGVPFGGNHQGLEATYEESKLERGFAVPTSPEIVWKLPMRNPSEYGMYAHSSNTPSLEATYEESKRRVDPVLQGGGL